MFGKRRGGIGGVAISDPGGRSRGNSNRNKKPQHPFG